MQVTENWFYQNKDLESYEVADFLEEIISNEFNLRIDDGSPEEIARTVCDYFSICSTSSEENVRIKLQRNDIWENLIEPIYFLSKIEFLVWF